MKKFQRTTRSSKLSKTQQLFSDSKYDFDDQDFILSSREEKLGRLLLVLIDGPQSLNLRQASKRLEVPLKEAKSLIKNQRQKFFESKQSSESKITTGTSLQRGESSLRDGYQFERILDLQIKNQSSSIEKSSVCSRANKSRARKDDHQSLNMEEFTDGAQMLNNTCYSNVQAEQSTTRENLNLQKSSDFQELSSSHLQPNKILEYSLNEARINDSRVIHLEKISKSISPAQKPSLNDEDSQTSNQISSDLTIIKNFCQLKCDEKKEMGKTRNQIYDEVIIDRSEVPLYRPTPQWVQKRFQTQYDMNSLKIPSHSISQKMAPQISEPFLANNHKDYIPDIGKSVLQFQNQNKIDTNEKLEGISSGPSSKSQHILNGFNNKNLQNQNKSQESSINIPNLQQQGEEFQALKNIQQINAIVFQKYMTYFSLNPVEFIQTFKEILNQISTLQTNRANMIAVQQFLRSHNQFQGWQNFNSLVYTFATVNTRLKQISTQTPPNQQQCLISSLNNIKSQLIQQYNWAMIVTVINNEQQSIDKAIMASKISLISKMNLVIQARQSNQRN